MAQPREMWTVDADDAEICVESIGGAENPAILLMAGAASSMDWWEDALCELLADGGRRVIRYDYRDTGRSTTWPAGKPGYTGTDLITDAVMVLDALSIGRGPMSSGFRWVEPSPRLSRSSTESGWRR